MTTEEMNEVKLSGVWRNGIGERFPTLLHVGEFDIGYSVWGDGMTIKVHVHAKVLKMIEGAGFPRRLEMVMPKNGYTILIDSLFARLSAKTLEIKATGFLYGKGSLDEAPPEGAELMTTLTTHATTSPEPPTDPLAPYRGVPIAPPQFPQSPGVWEYPYPIGSEWGTKATYKLSSGDAIVLVESPDITDGSILTVSQNEMHTAWSSLMKDFEEFVP